MAISIMQVQINDDLCTKAAALYDAAQAGIQRRTRRQSRTGGRECGGFPPHPHITCKLSGWMTRMGFSWWRA